MRNNNRLLFIFLFFTISASSQNEERSLSLLNIITDLSTQHSVLFSYADEDVKDLYLNKWNSKLSFNRSLKILNKYLPITFKRINESTIAITRTKARLNLCGSVIDELGDPIPNAIVNFSLAQTNTDSGGNFNLATNSRIKEVIVYSPGYKTAIIPIQDFDVKSCSGIVLTKINFSNVELDEVLLKNFITSGISKNRKGYIEINYKDFGILPGLIESDVLLSAQALPSIQSVNERVSNLNIRGGTNDQNLLLWDGIKMYQSGHFFGLISAFNPETTQKATIYTNGTSSKYTDGISGTIVMETDNTIVKKSKGSAGLNLLNGNLNFDIPLSKKSSIQFAGRHSLNNIYQTPTYNSYFDQAFRDTEVLGGFDSSVISNQSFNFYDTSLRFLSKLSDKTFLKVNAILISNDLTFTENGNIDEKLSMTQSGVSQNNIAAGFLLNHSWNNKITSEIQTYATNYNLESNNTNFTQNQRLIQENDVLEFSTKLATSYKLTKDLKFSGGYQFTETGVRNLADVTNPIFRSDIKEVVRTNALYFESDTKFLKGKGRAIIGIRGNHLGKLDSVTIEPRAVFNYKILKGLTAEVKGEYKSQITSQIINLQNDFIGVDNRRWVLSNNETIPIITAKQLSFGLNYTTRDLLISSEYYTKEVQGITTQSQGFLNQLQFINTTGSYMVTGFDFLISKNFGDINTSLSYSFSNNNYSWKALPNETIRSFPNNNEVRHSINGIFDYTYKRIKVAAGVNWRTGKPFTPLDTISPLIDGELNFSNPNSDNIEDYLRIDLSATYNFRFNKSYEGFIGLSLWNITNESNELERTFLNTNDEPIAFSRRALERTPNFSFKLSF